MAKTRRAPPNCTIPLTLSGYTPVPDVIAQDPDLGSVSALVWGLVWRFSKLEGGACYASQSTLAFYTGISRKTVTRHLQALCEKGYVEDLTPDLLGKPHTYVPTNKLDLKVTSEMVVHEDVDPKPKRTKRRAQKDRNAQVPSKYAEYIEH